MSDLDAIRAKWYSAFAALDEPTKAANWLNHFEAVKDMRALVAEVEALRADYADALAKRVKLHNEWSANYYEVRTEVARLRAVLTFYADPKNWQERQTVQGAWVSAIHADFGNKAREALARDALGGES